ncbi:MAG: hypothetical protein A2W31_14900 [Planctomycetes bacterium RBG_16_64_10]|nr:MAG: hypothetical protein A2W31_14900 [Planctomycetes bacterium RBG_16_64_10]
MHAHNPVDWYPWGAEALARARRDNKLIFLSIGYSSCHWCHVMQRESFMDEAIARLLNEHFICIKVDREERPDIDEIYMTSLHLFFQLVHSPQGGGWPLSMFLTPDGEPIMGGTYWPPRAHNGQPGFEEMLKRMVELWQRRPDDVRDQGRQLADAVKQSMMQRESVDPVTLDMRLVDELADQLAARYDAQYGGFGYSEVDPRMPKFPEPSNLAFLLHRVRQHGDARAQEMAVTTLDWMARGGIHDQVGGGFHRYSTDRFWRIPHFEKMLYDNAQLASVYAAAYTLTERDDFRRVVTRLVEFVLREMATADGGFCSALDAETEGREGDYYVWSTSQLRTALAPEAYALVEDVFGVGGNPNLDGRYVLQVTAPWPRLTQRRGGSEADLVRQVDQAVERLFAARNERPRPQLDTKILTAWNGLMIRGIADAGRALGNDRYVAAAAKAADFVLARLRTPNGRLRRTYRAGHATLNAYLDDYAFLVDGLIALVQASGEKKWLKAAEQLTDRQIALFWDDQAGGFFFTSHDHEVLIARGKNPTDSGLPSGNAVSVGNLIYLTRALDRPDYLPYAERTVLAALPFFRQVPTAMPRMGMALADYLETRAAGVQPERVGPPAQDSIP